MDLSVADKDYIRALEDEAEGLKARLAAADGDKAKALDARVKANAAEVARVKKEGRTPGADDGKAKASDKAD